VASVSSAQFRKGDPPPAEQFAGGLRIVELDTGTTEAPEAFRPATPGKPGQYPALPSTLLGLAFSGEVEPNGTSATATPLPGTSGVVQANVFPGNDVDFFSFTAAAGDRIYAATMTSLNGRGLFDSDLTVIASDGTTTIELDNDDGSFGASSSSIAGATLPTAGTYFLRVRYQASTTLTIHPYRLHYQLRSGSPTAETEANDTFPGQALPAGGWVSGSTSGTTDVDFFSLNLNAGDTVWVSVDLDPERDTSEWNAQVGLGAFGTPPVVLVVNDGGTATPDSESFFLTVKAAGTYGIFVGVPTGGTTFGTYHLSATVYPAVNEGVSCTTYSSADSFPITIPTGPAVVTSTLVVPGNPRIADLDVTLNLTHNFMADLDIQLTAPAGVGGNTVGLLSDIGSVTAGSQTTMDLTFDDEAAIPSSFTIVQNLTLAPELNYRLRWFDGQPAGGTWTLTIRDDATGDGGSLTGWSLRICEPPPPPACAPGFVPTTVFTTDFEADAAGFTSSGTQNEWERGTPAYAGTTTSAAFSGCNSGTNCWKTDLDNTYNASSDQTLLSAPINLAGFSPPVVVSWAQKYQLESAAFDRASVNLNEVGNLGNTRNLFLFLDADMFETVGATPTVNNNELAGWGTYSARADSFAGLNTELRFNLLSDTSIQRTGWGIDDVTVTACRAVSADLSITKTDGVATAVPGGSVTYTITASNAGPDPVTGATVADTFPASLKCTWTCVGAGGGTCTAAGAGNINDAANLPAGGSATYTASCNIAASATGSLVNTATVSSLFPDPIPGNNSATDTDTLTPQADLAITKSDGATNEIPGTPVTYTISATNIGPSNALGSTVADTFPASLSGCTWTCAGSGGGTCTAAGSGNLNDTVNLPAAASVTYTATCNISAAATGSLVNTATAATPAGVTDPAPANNTFTDNDTLTPEGDVAITKTDNLTNASPGQAITYTLVVTNPGPSDGVDFAVDDLFSANLTGVSWSCVGTGGGTCTAGPTGGDILDSVDLPAGATLTYTVNGTISNLFLGTLTNTALVAVNPLGLNPPPFNDPNTANNSATDNTQVASAAAISGTKAVAGTFEEGGAITYTIVLTNGSAAGQLDNPGDEFTDTLPGGLTLTSASATSGTAATAGNTVTWNGAISGNGSVSITIDATIGAGSAGLTLSNQGTFNFDADGNGSNESSGTTDDPGLPGGTDPTDLVVGSGVNVLEIPTLGEYGLMFLVLMLAGLGFGVIRRRG
ncbi:MAG: IPTL-CTERM sorting domain-containing protein, partial [Thermoanaerobaculia bacterium]|nr:IPTL-CTERM sorting domain-containing protein [Thermoanaerobaculia bacterium]